MHEPYNRLYDLKARMKFYNDICNACFGVECFKNENGVGELGLIILYMLYKKNIFQYDGICGLHYLEHEQKYFMEYVLFDSNIKLKLVGIYYYNPFNNVFKMYLNIEDWITKIIKMLPKYIEYLNF